MNASFVNENWPWLALALLGAYHGLNPAMGWLFAVSLGLQERRTSAVLRAFLPISLGHASAVLAAVLLVGVAQLVVPLGVLSYACGGTLILFGLYKLIWRKHPRWVGMRVGFKDLTVWSFLMASAHGAGLMLIPVLLKLSSAEPVQATHEHGAHTGMSGAATVMTDPTVLTDLAAVGVHTLAMFAVMAAIAVLVYEKLGVMILKRTWFNVDLLWAGALVAAGITTLLV